MSTKLVATAMILAGGVSACGPLPHSKEAGAVSALDVKAVAWNAANADVGKVRAVADTNDVVAVFADEGATVFTSGAVVAQERSIGHWVDADTIPGADGSARWIIGVDAQGRVFHLRGRSAFEDVSARYGLAGKRVRGAAVFGPDFVGFLLDGEVAIADGHHVTRFATSPFDQLVGGGGFGAGVAQGRVEIFGAANHALQSFPLEGAKYVALAADGRLYAASSRAVYARADSGELRAVYETSEDSIHGLVSSGQNVWFADGSELGVLDAGHVAESSGARVARDAKLASSSTGDVWVLAAGQLQRFARADAEPSMAQAWTSTLAPIFGRACAACHLPNGSSGIDLSTASAWQSRRALIKERVVDARTMPPQGHAITDADRDAIRAWAK